MDPEPARVSRRVLRQRDVGEYVLARAARPPAAPGIPGRTRTRRRPGSRTSLRYPPGMAPAGGHTANSPARSPPGRTFGPSSPLACRVHGRCAAPSSGRACTSTVRCPDSSGAPTVTWTWTAPLGGQHQRGFQGELLEAAAAGLVPGPDRELHERGPGQQHRAGHRVVGQPRLRLPREPPGEHQPLTRGQFHRRAQQRMASPSPARADSRRRSAPAAASTADGGTRRSAGPPAARRPAPPPSPRPCRARAPRPGKPATGTDRHHPGAASRSPPPARPRHPPTARRLPASR